MTSLHYEKCSLSDCEEHVLPVLGSLNEQFPFQWGFDGINYKTGTHRSRIFGFSATDGKIGWKFEKLVTVEGSGRPLEERSVRYKCSARVRGYSVASSFGGTLEGVVSEAKSKLTEWMRTKAERYE